MEQQTPQRIKPLLTQTLHIRNIQQYKDFFRKRPSKALNFKFTKLEIPSYPAYDEKMQTKLQQAVKRLKFIGKVDLSEFKVSYFHINKNKSLSIFKRLSKTKNISIFRPLDDDQVTEGYVEKWLKYFPRILHLTYRLMYIDFQAFLDYLEDQGLEDPLKYIKYCPKIRVLKIDTNENTSCIFAQKTMKFKRCPASLKCFLGKSSKGGLQDTFAIQHLKDLKTIGLTSYDKNLHVLLNMRNLQELDLQFRSEMNPEHLILLKTIADRGLLKKVKLDLDFEVSSFEEIFNAFRACQLVYFSFKAVVLNDSQLEQISKFLEHMDCLEYLKLKLDSRADIKAADEFKKICQQISKFQALRHLKITFQYSQPEEVISIRTDFLPSLQNVFAKIIKLETLCLIFNPINSTEAFASLTEALKGSSNSLQKLKIDFGTYSPEIQYHDMLVNFIKSLKSIRVLELPGLEIPYQSLWTDFAPIIQTFKDLRILRVGEIHYNVSRSVFIDGLEMILKKRGLERFYCEMETALLRVCQAQKSRLIDMKKIQKINPSLEVFVFSRHAAIKSLFQPLYNWKPNPQYS